MPNRCVLINQVEVSLHFLEMPRRQALIQFWLTALDMSLPERLLTESSLTTRQLASLTSYIRVASGEIGLRDAASIASSGRIRGDPQKMLTLGSYYRTLTQAKTNVRKSLVTILIGIQLGVVRPEELRRLFELVGTGVRELSGEEQERFVGILQALLDRIVL